ncbi:hypothetical protein G7046_g5944 [Stylonectria norvegica]|nr:hypothetical protein G7046_g5944 [Stylonectria norvegica]
MPPRYAAPCRYAALGPSLASEAGLWITDAMLVGALERYHRASAAASRRLSSCPGPIESRRRLGKRHMTAIMHESAASPPPWATELPFSFGEWKWQAPTSPADRKLQQGKFSPPQLMERLISWLENQGNDAVLVDAAPTHLCRLVDKFNEGLGQLETFERSTYTTRKRTERALTTMSTLCHNYRAEVVDLIKQGQISSEDLILAISPFDAEIVARADPIVLDHYRAFTGRVVLEAIAAKGDASLHTKYGAQFWQACLREIRQMTFQRKTLQMLRALAQAFPGDMDRLIGHDDMLHLARGFITEQASWRNLSNFRDHLEFSMVFQRLTPGQADQLLVNMNTYLGGLRRKQVRRSLGFHWALQVAHNPHTADQFFTVAEEACADSLGWTDHELFALMRARLLGLGLIDERHLDDYSELHGRRARWRRFFVTLWQSGEPQRMIALREIYDTFNRMGHFDILVDQLMYSARDKVDMFRALCVDTNDYRVALHLRLAFEGRRPRLNLRHKLASWDWTAWTKHAEHIIKDSELPGDMIWKILGLDSDRRNPAARERGMGDFDTKTQLLEAMGKWFLESSHLNDRQLLRRIQTCNRVFLKLQPNLSDPSIGNLTEALLRDLERGWFGRASRLDYLVYMIRKHVGEEEAKRALVQITGWRWTIDRYATDTTRQELKKQHELAQETEGSLQEGSQNVPLEDMQQQLQGIVQHHEEVEAVWQAVESKDDERASDKLRSQQRINREKQMETSWELTDGTLPDQDLLEDSLLEEVETRQQSELLDKDNWAAETQKPRRESKKDRRRREKKQETKGKKMLVAMDEGGEVMAKCVKSHLSIGYHYYCTSTNPLFKSVVKLDTTSIGQGRVNLGEKGAVPHGKHDTSLLPHTILTMGLMSGDRSIDTTNKSQSSHRNHRFIAPSGDDAQPSTSKCDCPSEHRKYGSSWSTVMEQGRGDEAESYTGGQWPAGRVYIGGYDEESLAMEMGSGMDNMAGIDLDSLGVDPAMALGIGLDRHVAVVPPEAIDEAIVGGAAGGHVEEAIAGGAIGYLDREAPAPRPTTRVGGVRSHQQQPHQHQPYQHPDQQPRYMQTHLQEPAASSATLSVPALAPASASAPGPAPLPPSSSTQAQDPGLPSSIPAASSSSSSACDKSHPCANCVRFRRECVYLGPKLDEAGQLRLTQIKDKVGSLEHQLEREVARAGSDLSRPNTQQRILADDVEGQFREGQGLEPTDMVALDHTYEDCADDTDEVIDLGVMVGKMRLTDRIGGFSRPRVAEELSASIAGQPTPPPRTTSQPSANFDFSIGTSDPSWPDYLRPGANYIPPSSGLLIGQPVVGGPSLEYLLPTKGATDRLIQQYFEAVHPIVRCVHRPSFEASYREFWECVLQNIEPRPSLQALVFAAMFSGAVSMDDVIALGDFGKTKAELHETLKLGTETSLSKANFLRTTRVETVQAFVMYLVCVTQHRHTVDATSTDHQTQLPLCRDELSRAHSVLVGAAIRMAECMGLHRDGETYELDPLDTHVRRLVWHQLCFLDIRTCEVHGPRPAIRREDYETKLPLNCDEEQLRRNAPAPQPADRWTAMTLPLMRFEINEMLRIIWLDRRRVEAHTITLTEVLAKIDSFRRAMLDKYDRHLDDAAPLQRYARLLMHLFLCKLHCMTLHVYHFNASAQLPPRLASVLVSSAILMLEMAIQLETNPAFHPWVWYAGAYHQFQIALVLATDVYYRPRSAEASRIWVCLDWVFGLDRNMPPEAKCLYILGEVVEKMGAYQLMRKARAPTALKEAVPSRNAIAGKGEGGDILPSHLQQQQQQQHQQQHQHQQHQQQYQNTMPSQNQALETNIPPVMSNPSAQEPLIPVPSASAAYMNAVDAQTLWATQQRSARDSESPEASTSNQGTDSNPGARAQPLAPHAMLGLPEMRPVVGVDWDIIDTLFMNDPNTGGLIIPGYHDPSLGMSWQPSL